MKTSTLFYLSIVAAIAMVTVFTASITYDIYSMNTTPFIYYTVIMSGIGTIGYTVTAALLADKLNKTNDVQHDMN